MTVSITVGSVNDAPVGTDATLTLLQDRSHVFAIADFGYADPGDAPANAFAAVQLSSLPSAGIVTLDGTAVTAGQWISAADLAAGRLVYAPAPTATAPATPAWASASRTMAAPPTAASIPTPSSARSRSTSCASTTRRRAAPAASPRRRTRPTSSPSPTSVLQRSGRQPGRRAAGGVRIAVAAGRRNARRQRRGGHRRPVRLRRRHRRRQARLHARGRRQRRGVRQLHLPGAGRRRHAPTAASTSTRRRARMTIDVTAVNDAPTGRQRHAGDASRTRRYVFTIADFGFTDPHDTPAERAAVGDDRQLPGGRQRSPSNGSRGHRRHGRQRRRPSPPASSSTRRRADANGAAYASFAFRVQRRRRHRQRRRRHRPGGAHDDGRRRRRSTTPRAAPARPAAPAPR